MTVAEEGEKKFSIGKVLFTQDEIRNRAKELGAQITKDYEGKTLIILGMLKGAVPWMAELIKYIDLDVRIDFIAASSYGSGTTTTGVVKVKKDVVDFVFAECANPDLRQWLHEQKKKTK